MERLLKLVLLVAITALLVGCKLAVIVVEGGDVHWTGSDTCAAGTVCVIEVNDTNFSEKFTALPNEGWYFEKWNAGDKFTCGDSNNLKCTLSLEGTEGNVAIEQVLASSETFYLMPVFRQFSDSITVEGREWYQPYLFTGFTWQDIHAVCPAHNGECSGLLNGYDMTGWMWASIEEVNGLFNFYIGSDSVGRWPHNQGFPGDVMYDFFSDGWRPTRVSEFGATSARFEGWLRNVNEKDAAYYAWLLFSYQKVPHYTGRAQMSTVHTSAPTLKEPQRGGWFYRVP